MHSSRCVLRTVRASARYKSAASSRVCAACACNILSRDKGVHPLAVAMYINSLQLRPNRSHAFGQRYAMRDASNEPVEAARTKLQNSRVARVFAQVGTSLLPSWNRQIKPLIVHVRALLVSISHTSSQSIPPKPQYHTRPRATCLETYRDAGVTNVSNM